MKVLSRFMLLCVKKNIVSIKQPYVPMFNYVPMCQKNIVSIDLKHS